MATKGTKTVFQKAHVSLTAAQNELKKATKLAKTPELRDSLKRVATLINELQM